MNLHLVTGGSRGVGEALCRHLLEAGDEVIEISRSGFPGKAPRIQSFSADLTKVEAIPTIFEKIQSKLDLTKYQWVSLTNNAAMLDPVGPVETLKPSVLQENLALNLLAPMVLSSLFLAWTKSFPGNRVIANVSSGVAQRPIGRWAAYSAAKAALESFSQSLAMETPENLKVISFQPGVVDTEMQAFIRGVSETDFPGVERFRALKAEGVLQSPDKVARVLGEAIRQARQKYAVVSA